MLIVFENAWNDKFNIFKTFRKENLPHFFFPISSSPILHPQFPLFYSLKVKLFLWAFFFIIFKIFLLKIRINNSHDHMFPPYVSPFYHPYACKDAKVYWISLSLSISFHGFADPLRNLLICDFRTFMRQFIHMTTTTTTTTN